jgi:hypothetical protein
VADRDLVERLATADWVGLFVAGVETLDGALGLEIAQDGEQAEANGFRRNPLDLAIDIARIGGVGRALDQGGDVGHLQAALGLDCGVGHFLS